MKCYNHPNVDAVGMCKSCNKGVCRTCAKEANSGVACSGNCANKLNRRNLFSGDNIFIASSYKTLRGTVLVIISLFMVLSNILNPYGYIPFAVIGILFFLLGIYYLYLGALEKK